MASRGFRAGPSDRPCLRSRCTRPRPIVLVLSRIAARPYRCLERNRYERYRRPGQASSRARIRLTRDVVGSARIPPVAGWIEYGCELDDDRPWRHAWLPLVFMRTG